MKKAVSAATSAALLASLLATAVAPSVAASTLVTTAGVVPVGGTSATAASFQFCENTALSWPAATTGTITVTITPYAAGSVTFTNATGGAPVPTFTQNPGGVGASATASGNLLTVTIGGGDGVNVLCFTVGNLYISAAAGTATGAITATTGGSVAASTYASATTSATGTLAVSAASSATSFLVNVSSSCPFVAPGSGAGPAGDFIIDGVDAGATGTATPAAITAGQQTLAGLTPAALGTATTAGHAVTQANVPNCSISTLASPGTVGNAVTQTAVTGSVNPGEQNQATGSTTITETAAGYLAAGTVLTFAISAPTSGVTFSTSPTAFVTGGTGLTLGSGTTSALCVLQFGGTSCQVTVYSASTAAASITLAGATTAGILLDMATTVPNGTAVNVTVTGSPAIVVNVSSNTIANASRVIVGVATQPIVYINYNNQPSGMVSLTEAGAGFFTASGVNDAFGLCITTGESFTYTPYAIVATGDLKLLSSTSTAATTQVGTLYNVSGMSCVRWSVYSASTVASTIDIVGATATAALAIGPANGPTLSVPGYLAPGTTQSVILVGSQAGVAAGTASSSLVSNATRMFKSGVVVTAVSQPAVPAGTTDSLAGNLTISETLNGQFKPGQSICVTILPRTSNGARTQDTFIKTATTNDLPVISTNAASGLLTNTVATPGCGPDFYIGYYGYSYPVVPNPGASFEFDINQQSFGGTLGVITISNIHLITTADAPTGPVLVDVLGSGSSSGTSVTESLVRSTDSTTGSNTTTFTVSGVNTLVAGQIVTIAGTITPNINGTYVVQSATSTSFTINLAAPITGTTYEGPTATGLTSGGNAAVAFETVVSNAKIGVLPSIKFTVGTAAGATKNATFTAKTKVVKLSQVNKYVTWRFTAPKALSGKIVTIWVSTKLADGTWGAPKALTSRLVDINGNAYFWWKSTTATWVAVSASYAGDSNYAMSLSASPQARWMK